MSFILKNWKVPKIETRNVVVHACFLLIALSYIFYNLPSYSGSMNFHLWAPTLLALLDISAVYCFFVALTYFKKFKLLCFLFMVFCSIHFLYYSSGVNSLRTSNTVIQIKEMQIWYNKDWLIATFPRLVLVILAALFYYAVFQILKHTKWLWSKVNLEFIINALLIIGFLLYDQPSKNTGDIIESLLIKTIIICICYGSAFFLAPELFKKRNYLRFAISLVIGYLVITCIIIAISFYKGELVYNDLQELIYKLSPVIGLFTLAGLLYGFIRHLIISRFKKTEEQLGHTTSELLLLKSQVNPHFLFNTLNTLYATALEEDAKVTASATAKLANLVRYMQQDMQQEFIPLDREAGYILDYINIQKLRIASPIAIKTTFDDFGDTQISPGLLIPFVENAFKYGIDPDSTSSISVQLIQQKDHIHFQCQNTFNPTQSTYYREKGFGIGIKNTRERLKLIYPKRYDLQIDKSNKLFTINLKIKTV